MFQKLVGFCRALVNDPDAMAALRGFQGDLFIGDVVTPCSWALSDLLRCAAHQILSPKSWALNPAKRRPCTNSPCIYASLCKEIVYCVAVNGSLSLIIGVSWLVIGWSCGWYYLRYALHSSRLIYIRTA